MIFNRIITLIRENRARHKKTESLVSEVIWANVYHDSIRGMKCLDDLSLNIGRWAGNYSFFYILKRILIEIQPDSILELGLGESSKFISTLINKGIVNSTHLIVEHDKKWIEAFNSNFELTNKSKILNLKIEEKKALKLNYLGYKDIEEIPENFVLYIIDGPFASKNFSRFDIVKLAEKFDAHKDFIIIMDDYNRTGEKETVKELLAVLKRKNISVKSKNYDGIKSQLVITTKRYEMALNL